ncbi:hypothetical protein AS200_25230 [Streptomyces sp. CdTB01]|nr:hypothetical protein AS200_25230 [Streptomyces sp. CdTB01]
MTFRGALPAHQPDAVRQQGSVHPAGQAQLRQHVGHMRLHRGGRQMQVTRDLLVGAAVADRGEHVTLPFREHADGVAEGVLGRQEDLEAIDEPTCQRRADHRMPAGDRPDGVDQLRRRHVLQQDAADPGTQRPEQFGVVGRVGQQSDPGPLRADRGLQPVQEGLAAAGVHAGVDEDDVRLVPTGQQMRLR